MAASLRLGNSSSSNRGSPKGSSGQSLVSSWQWLGQQVNRLRARLHRMNDQLLAAVKDQDHGFQEMAPSVEPEPQLPCRTVLVEFIGPDGPRRGLGAC